jgi:hypothetical protein
MLRNVAQLRPGLGMACHPVEAEGRASGIQKSDVAISFSEIAMQYCNLSSFWAGPDA